MLGEVEAGMSLKVGIRGKAKMVKIKISSVGAKAL